MIKSIRMKNIYKVKPLRSMPIPVNNKPNATISEIHKKATKIEDGNKLYIKENWTYVISKKGKITATNLHSLTRGNVPVILELPKKKKKWQPINITKIENY